MPKVTIEDISRETGLSRGTVSRALNNRPDISVETRQRVLEACTKLRYVPSHAARTLATGRNLMVAVFVDDLSLPLSVSILRGVLGTTGPRGYFVHVAEMNPRVPPADRIAQVPAERIDGAILIGSLEPDGAKGLAAMLEHRPLGLTSAIDGLAGDTFEPDYLEAGRIAGRLMLNARAKRIGLLGRGAAGCAERARGFREIIAGGADGAELQQIDVGQGIDSKAADDLDALVFDESILAFAGIHPAGKGKRTPQMLGFGRIAALAPDLPGLTIVDYAGEEIGRRVSHALIQRIENDTDAAPQHVRVAPRVLNPLEDADR